MSITADRLAPTSTRASTRTTDLGDRAAGLGALGFAGFVVLQNVLRGTAPQPGADVDEVITWFADHRATTVVLMGTFVIALASLVAFLGGTARRFALGDRPAWGAVGAIGAGSIIALFAGVVGAEQALSVVATGDNPNPAVVEALWNLHNSLFTVNLMFIGVALVGLSRAGIAAGITPRAFGRLAPVGAALLALGTVSGPFTAGGDAMPMFGVSVLGFLVWLAFLATTGRRLVRSAVAR